MLNNGKTLFTSTTTCKDKLNGYRSRKISKITEKLLLES